MLERQEKTALAVLICVVGIVLAVHLLFDAVGRPLVAAPYSEEVSDGAFVLLEGRIEEIRKTSTGGHRILTVNGTLVADISLVVAPLAGDVQVGAGFFGEDQVAGRVTAYDGFSVWSIA